MSEETKPDSEQERRDFWKMVEPWYERVRAAYYSIGVLTALGFGVVYVVRTLHIGIRCSTCYLSSRIMRLFICSPIS